MKDIWLLVVGGVIGAVIGIVMTALLHPLSRRLERFSRKLWRISPLDVWTDSDPSIIWAGYPPWTGATVWFPDFPNEAPPDTCTDWRSWALKSRGADGEQSTLKVTVQAHKDVSLVIETVKVRQRQVKDFAHVGGYLLTYPVAGAAISPRHIEVNLDWGGGIGTATWFDQSGRPIKPPQLTLNAGEFEQFHIWAKTERGRHEWWLELILLVDGRRMVRPISEEQNKPFVTIGCSELPELFRHDGQWKYREDSPI